MITVEPFNTRISPATKPMSHQLRDWENTRELEYWAHFHEMGTGKSKIIIDTAWWLYAKREIDGVLITSYKGNYLSWMHEEIPKHMPSEINTRVAKLSAYMRTNEKQDLERILSAKDDTLDVLCTNIDSFASKKSLDKIMRFVQNHYVLFVVDESDAIKNPSTKRTKAVIKIGQACDYRRILTGTPIDESPVDLWSQAQFLSPEINSNHRSLTAFKATYCEEQLFIEDPKIGRFRLATPNDVITRSTRHYSKITGYRNQEELAEWMTTWSSRFTKDECMDLPEKVYQTRYVEHSPEQERAYDELLNDAVYLFDGGQVSVTSAITLLQKLHRINCGHFVDDLGEIHYLENERLKALKDEVFINRGKIIIWCAFREDVKILMREFGDQAVDYYGATSDKDREKNKARFKNDPDCRFLIGTAGAGGRGLTLNEAKTTIYYSNSHKLGHRMQSEDRNHRKGQTQKVTYIDLVVRNTVDERIVKALKNKKDVADFVVDDYRKLILNRD